MRILFLVVVFLVIFPNTFANEKKEVVFGFASEHSFPDYIGSGLKVRWPRPGLSVELAKLIEEHLDVKIKFVRFPMKRLRLVQMKEGMIDGTFIVSYSKSREKEWASYPKKNGQVEIDKRITTLRYVLYKLKDTDIDWDGKKFYNIKNVIGAPRGWSIAKNLKEMGVPVKEVSENRNLFKMLASKRIDGVATLETSGDPVVESDPQFKNIIKVKAPIKEKYYYISLSHKFVKTHPKLAEAIWNVMPKIRASKKYKEIISIYKNLPLSYGENWK